MILVGPIYFPDPPAPVVLSMMMGTPSVSAVLFICILPLALSYTPFPPNRFEERCNYQGITYEDSGFQLCECFECFTGPTCADLDTTCTVDVAGGNPTLLQQFWEQMDHPSPVAEEMAYYRSPYELSSAGRPIPPAPTPAPGFQPFLRDAITSLHKMVGNAETEGYHIVIGHGVTQLIGAVCAAFSTVYGRTLPVYADIPYFGTYQRFANFNPRFSYWNGADNQTDPNIVEFVTYPNNPDGVLRTPVYNHSTSVVHDMVYYWPGYVNVTKKLDEDVMMFSLSKMSGHGGTRFGWALVKDPVVAQAMSAFVSANQIHVSVDTQFRAWTMINAVVEGQGGIFDSVRDIFSHRWEQMESLFSQQSRFSLHSPRGSYYMWIHCDHADDTNCYQAFLAAGIEGVPGSSFGDTDKWVRVHMVAREQEYTLLMNRMKDLFLRQGQDVLVQASFRPQNNPVHC